MKFALGLAIAFNTFLGCASINSEGSGKSRISSDPITEHLDFELERNLIVVPVKIDGEVYRFIWDTGAATAISTRLQNKMGYRTLRRTTISDSQNNRAKTRFVRVKEFQLGTVNFYKQSALVIDFQKHPILACMDLDGIIGRNTHRLANWTIDYQAEVMTITNQPVAKPEGGFETPFSYDDDYDIKLNMRVGSARVTNIKFDTGFVGGVSLPNRLFRDWKGLVSPDTVYRQIGYQQSGLMGVVESEDTYFAYADSLKLGSFIGYDVEVENGSSGLVGNQVWSQFILTLDWQNKKLYGLPAEEYTHSFTTWGFAVSWDPITEQAFVISVLEGSQAEKEGLKPLMVVERVGEVDFTAGATYCDYLGINRWGPQGVDSLDLVVEVGEGQPRTLTIEKACLRNGVE
ncbi:MAG: aspartyl protease family protein [Bacteroidota bacterium]